MIYKKIKMPDGRREIYVFGVRVLTYVTGHKLVHWQKAFCADVQKFYALNKNKSTIENLVLGSSHAWTGFVPADNRDFNLGNSSQDLYRAYWLYKYVLANGFHNLKNIILYFDVFHPGVQLERTKEAYKCVPYQYFYNIPYAFPLDDEFASLDKDKKTIFRKIIRKTRIPDDYRGCSPWVDKHADNIRVADIAAKHIKNNTRHNGQVKYVEKMCALARQNGHRLYIVLPTYRSDYLACLPKPWNDLFCELYDVLNKNTDVVLINLMGDPDFADSDFMDFDHAGMPAAMKMTQKIKQVIKRMSGIPQI